MRVKSYFLKVCIAACLLPPLAWAGQSAPLSPAPLRRQAPDPIYVSIQVKQRNIDEVMAAIASQTGLNFHYDKAALDLGRKVTLHCDKTPIAIVLDMLAKQTGFRFILKENRVIVGPGNSGEDALGAVRLLNGASLEREISGHVTDAKGNPLPGATVLVRNCNRGVQTDEDGQYTLRAATGEILVFRSVGFMNREVLIGSSNVLDVTLEENIKGLNEFVVTTLGIPKKTRELPYATEQLNNDDLSRVKDANVINSLAGKVAGVTINRSASGIGGSARVVLRGNKSTRENQPLYIIDGVPMANFTPSQPQDIWGQSSGIVGNCGRDGGDGISNLNPDDIESISILKGASAAALYGSQAANGVIVITTKKGKAGKGHISFSSDLSIETPMLLPKLQYRYGQTNPPYNDDKGAPQPGSTDSWGAPVNAQDHVKRFFNTGATYTNSISFSGGSQKTQFYLSYSNVSNKSILPNSKFHRHTVNYRGTGSLLDNRLQLDANITFLAQDALNRPSSGLYYNSLSGLYSMPRGLDFNSYRQYEYFDDARNMPMQNWWNIRNDKDWTGQDDQQNPYWVLYRALREENRYRGMASLSLKYQLNSWLSAQARGNIDKSYDEYEMKAYAGTQQVLSPPNGRYTLEKETNTQLYGDLMLNASRKLGERLHLLAMIGGSISDVKAHDKTLVSTNPTANPGLSYANKFTVDNIAGNALDAQRSIERKQMQAVFASAQLGYRNALFLDLTGRNDWSSTFAFTPIKNKGYFYYSAGLTLMLSDLVKLPAPLSFAKARISYARVGNDIAPFVSRPARFTLQTIAGVTHVNFNIRAPYPGVYLRPEDNRSLEAGAELRLLKDRVSLDFTWYKNNNYQQYMEVRAPSGSGYLFYYLNLGNIQNEGFEAMLTVTPIRKKDFRWTSFLNFTRNRNSVVKLTDAAIPGAGPENFYILTDFVANMYGSFIKEGGSWGDIYTNKELYRNEKGQYVIDNQGNLVSRNVFKKVGNPNPRFTMGWSNTLEYRGLTLSCLLDGRFGGQVMSVTQAVLDNYGVSEVSAAARDNGGVVIDAVQANGQAHSGKYSARKYYAAIGGRAGIGEMYMYDATNIRLRELALSYRLPLKAKWIRSLSVGLTGRNLCFLHIKAPFDPEVSMGSGNGLQGIDVFGLPATRSMGANVKVMF